MSQHYEIRVSVRWNKNNNEQRTVLEKKKQLLWVKKLAKTWKIPWLARHFRLTSTLNDSANTNRDTFVDCRSCPIHLQQLWHLMSVADAVQAKQRNFGFFDLYGDREAAVALFEQIYEIRTHWLNGSELVRIKKKALSEREREGKGRREREREKWVKCQWVVLEVRSNSLQRQKDRCGCNSWVLWHHNVICHWVVPNVIRFNKGVEWRETD